MQTARCGGEASTTKEYRLFDDGDGRTERVRVHLEPEGRPRNAAREEDEGGPLAAEERLDGRTAPEADRLEERAPHVPSPVVKREP